ncbi:MAG TPA: corrinoid protein [bacterium]|jgi:methanogenic corrinoid protein MtbC1
MTEIRKYIASELHEQLAQAVLDLDVARAAELAQLVLDYRYSARDAILNGLSEGMRRVGDRFCSHEFFVPEVLVAARAMYRGLNLLKPRMLEEGEASSGYRGKIAIAVVEGDLHDIGKNVVKLMLEAEGFELLDLGKNVPPTVISEMLQKDNIQILALSTLMTSTLAGMKNTVAAVRSQHPQIKVIVGGAPVSASFANDIGADGTAGDASGAVRLALTLAGQS